MLWLLGKNRVVTWGSLLGIYFMSARTKGFGWPRFRSNKKSCIPAAKALHAQMSEAVATGDKDTLRRICSAELFQTLAGAIDSRPPGIRTEWELVRYDNKWRYPRLADFRISYQPMASSKGMKLIKQAVVSISSVQRLTRYDDNNGGAKVPGSERERYMTEHVVLQSDVNGNTYKAEPWKLWGNLPEMPYETIRDDAIMYQEAMANNSRRRAT
jgi:protein MBA1